MFDLTVLPYFVFVFMAIPPFIFGYFKGWRSGLFTIILTLITGGILVGISVGIYEGTLWPLFRNIFVQSHNPAGLDVESLKEISKTSVVSISVGIALLPGVLIMWGLYMGFKKLLNKYMQPKIKKISNNEVGIYRKNLKLTRAGGVVLNGAAGLIIASAAAGAVSTLTVPSNKSNFFTSMTNAFGDGMTFGQGQYNEDYQRMFEFVNDGKYYQNQIDQFRTVFGQPQKASGEFGITQQLFDNFVNPTKTTIMGEHDKFIADTNLMAKDSEQISKALVLMLLNASQTSEDFHLVGFDPANPSLSSIDKDHEASVTLDTNAISTSETNIDDSTKTLSSFLQTNSFNIHWNEAGVKAAIKEFFESRFIAYEDSPYRYNVTHQEHALDDANDKLTRMRKRLVSDKTNITQYENTQKSNVAQIKSSGDRVKREWDDAVRLMKLIGLETTSEDYPTMPNQPIISVAPWNDQWTEYNEGTNGEVKHSFYMVVPIIQAVPSLPVNGSYAIKEAARIQNEKDLGLTQRALEAKTKANNNVIAANSELNVLQGSLRSIKDQLKSEKIEKTTKEAFITLYNTSSKDAAYKKAKDEEIVNDNLKVLRDNAQGDLDSANTKLRTAQIAQRTAATNLQTAQDVYDQGATQVNTLYVDLSEAKSELTIAKNEIKPLQDKLKSLKSDLAAKIRKDPSYSQSTAESGKISNAINSLNDANTDVTNAQTTVDDAQFKYDSAKTLLETKKSDLETAKREGKVSAQDVNAKQSVATKAQTVLTGAKNDFDASSTRLNLDVTERDDLDAKFNSYSSRVNNLENMINNDETTQRQNESDISDKESEISTLNGILNEKDREWTKADGISKLSSSDYKTKKKTFDDQVSKLRAASTGIATALSDGTSKWSEEQSLEKQIKDTISDKLILEDPTITAINPKDSIKSGAAPNSPKHDADHWSIKDQEWTVSDIENAKAQYVVIDKEKSELYKSRKEELIEDITKALS